MSLPSLSGCTTAEQGPELHQITGSVTYGGEPVQHGRISFVPDTTQGNSGPTGYAAIRNGNYDTAAQGGKGVVAGAVAVFITGQSEATADQTAEGVEDAGLIDFPPPLFENYQTTAEIGAGEKTITLDFDVPKK